MASIAGTHVPLENINGINLQTLVLMYQSPFTSLDANLEPLQILCLNIPKEAFTSDFRTWNDINRDQYRFWIAFLAWSTHRTQLGTSFKDSKGKPDPLYCAAEIPKVIIVVEELLTEEGAEEAEKKKESTVSENPETNQVTFELDSTEMESTFLGYRVWFFIIDPKFKLSDGIKQLIDKNYEDSFDKVKEVKDKNYRKTLTDDLHRVKDVDFYASEMVAGYRQNPTIFGKTLDNIHGVEDLMEENSTHIMNPKVTLSPENSFKMNPRKLCTKQADLDTYFEASLGDGQCFVTFRNNFPFPQRTYRLQNRYFDHFFLTNAPLPNALLIDMERKTVRCRTTWEAIESKQRDLLNANETGQNELASSLEDQIGVLEYELLKTEEEVLEVIQKLHENGNSGLSSQVPNTADVMAIFRSRNDFLKLAHVNRKRQDLIEERTEVGSPERVQAMNSFLQSTIPEFWRTFKFSNNVSPTIQSVRNWYNKLPLDKKWIEYVQSIRNLDPFGNMIVRMITEQEKILKINTNFRPLFMILFTTNSCFRFAFKIRPSLLISGDPEAGKSRVADAVAEDCSIETTVMNTGHLTARALDNDQDTADVCHTLHEAPIYQLGIDKDGKEIPANDTLKGAMTKQFRTTLAPDMDSKKRQIKVSVSRYMVSNVWITNNRLPSIHTSAMSRFIYMPMAKLERIDQDLFSSILSHDFLDNKINNNDNIRGMKLHQFFVIVVEKAIESCALGTDISTGVTKDMSNWIFAYFAKNFIPKPENRQVMMFEDLVRQCTLYYAVEMEYFSELGRGWRVDANGNPLPFDPLSLMSLRKWFCASQQITLFMVSLMDFVWIPYLKYDIANVAAHFIARGLTELGTGRFLPCETITPFRREIVKNTIDPAVAAASAGAPTERRTTALEERKDLRYIEIRSTAGCVRVAQQIQTHLSEDRGAKYSVNDVFNALLIMSGEFIESNQKQWDETGRLVDIPDTTERIPMVIMDTFPVGNTTYKRVCIAVEMIDLQHRGEFKRILDGMRGQFKLDHPEVDMDPNFQMPDVVKEMMVSAIRHRYQTGGNYITAFPKREYVEKKKRIVPFYNVFDTATIPEGTERDAIKFIANSNYYNESDSRILNSRPGAMETISEMQTKPFAKVDRDLDEIHFTSFWARSGIPIDENTMVAFPANTKDVLWNIRASIPEYNELAVVENYPADTMEKIRNKMDVWNMESEAEKTALSYNYSMICNGEANRSLKLNTTLFKPISKESELRALRKSNKGFRKHLVELQKAKPIGAFGKRKEPEASAPIPNSPEANLVNKKKKTHHKKQQELRLRVVDDQILDSVLF